MQAVAAGRLYVGCVDAGPPHGRASHAVYAGCTMHACSEDAGPRSSPWPGPCKLRLVMQSNIITPYVCQAPRLLLTGKGLKSQGQG